MFTELNHTTTIAIGLFVFFIVAAIINTMLNRARRRKIENQRAARTGGGTEEAPIHLTTPFSAGQSAPAESLSSDPQPTTAPASPAQPHDQDDDYVWE